MEDELQMLLAVHGSGMYLELSGVDTIVALNEWITKVVDTELFQTFQSSIFKIQVVGVPVQRQHTEHCVHDTLSYALGGHSRTAHTGRLDAAARLTPYGALSFLEV